MVPGPSRDDQQRHIMLGRHRRHQRLGPIPPSHPQQIRPLGHRLTGQRPHIHRPRPLQQHHLSPQGLGLVLEPEPGHLPAARTRIHDQERPPRRRSITLDHPLRDDLAGQRRPAGGHRPHQQPDRHHHHPQQPPAHVQHQHHQRRQHGHPNGQPAGHALVGQGPPHPSHRQAKTDHPSDNHGHTGPQPDRQQRHQHRHPRRHQGQPGQPPLGQRHPTRHLLLTGHHPRSPPTPPTINTTPSLDGHQPTKHHPKQMRFGVNPGRPTQLASVSARRVRGCCSGVEAHHVTIYRWVLRFTPLMPEAAGRADTSLAGGRDRGPFRDRSAVGASAWRSRPRSVGGSR